MSGKMLKSFEAFAIRRPLCSSTPVCNSALQTLLIRCFRTGSSPCDLDKRGSICAAMDSRRHSAGGKQDSNLTLQHILYKVPRLLQVIHKTDSRAILFSSSGLRQYLVNYVTSIEAPTAGLQLLVDQEWPPRLQKLDVCISKDVADPDKGLRALAGTLWPNLAVLDLNKLCQRAAAIQDLASAHLPALTAVNLAGNLLLDDAIKELVKLSWPRLEMLDLNGQEYSSYFDSKTAAYLVKGKWPRLKTLNVSGNNVCMGPLLNGNWPALEKLDMLDRFHDEDAPTYVKETSGLAWPRLKRLSLSDGAADDLGIAELSLTEWPCLEFVCLDGLSDEKVAEIFASCEWPALSHLELKEIYSAHQNAVMCTRLSKAHSPVLEILVICDYCPWAAGVLQLVQANWCNSRVLNMSCCALDSEAVSELSKGQWPQLHSLSVCEFPPFYWPTVSVKRFLDGAWPALCKLELSPSDCEAAAVLLSGSTELFHTVPDSDYYFYPSRSIRKTVTGDGPDHWPCLKFSAFVFVSFET